MSGLNLLKRPQHGKSEEKCNVSVVDGSEKPLRFEGICRFNLQDRKVSQVKRRNFERLFCITSRSVTLVVGVIKDGDFSVWPYN
jgi:hypothetical protein